MPLAVRFYDVVLTAHILAVVAAFGVTFAYPLMVATAMKVDPRSLPFLHTVQGRLGKFLVAPSVLIILAAGEYMANNGPYDHDDMWVNFGQIIAVVLLILGVGVFGPLERKLTRLSQRDVDAAQPGAVVVLGADYKAALGRIRIAGMASSLLVIAAVTLMATKPVL